MQRLHDLAEADSGTPYSAVTEARSANLYHLIGAGKLSALSTAFYTRVYADEPWFRAIFANTTRAAAEQNQRDFLAQEFGGPRAYEARKGHTALIGRHGPYTVDARAAQRWVALMFSAIDDVAINGQLKQLLRGYFSHMAYFIVHGKQLVSPMRTVGYYGKHTEGEV